MGKSGLAISDLVRILTYYTAEKPDWFGLLAKIAG